jgi:hypothetical protein
MIKKMVMFRISPELNDGDHYGVCKTKEQLIEAVSNWADNAVDGHPDECSIETIEMTEEEFNAIPES